MIPKIPYNFLRRACMFVCSAFYYIFTITPAHFSEFLVLVLRLLWILGFSFLRLV